MKPTLTLYGLNTWATAHDENLFDNLRMPTGIDVNILKQNIFLKAVGLEVVYADFDYMKEAIGVWSDAKAATFTGWINALTAEYNPIENYDRSETSSDTSTGNFHSENSGTQTEKVSAYDSTTFQNRGQTSGSGENTDTSSGTFNHTARVHGNIGVTSSMQLVTEEIKLRMNNLYDMIADQFVSDFCIMVY